MYPQPSKIDPVALDKPVFGSAFELRKESQTAKGKAAKISQDAETNYGKRTKTPQYIPYLTADGGTKYNTKYRTKNHNELNYLRKINTNIPTLAWMCNLRVGKSDNKPQMYTGNKLRKGRYGESASH